MKDEEKVAKLIQLLSDKYLSASMNFWRFVEQKKKVDEELKKLCNEYERNDATFDEKLLAIKKADEDKIDALKNSDEDLRFAFLLVAELDTQNAIEQTQLFRDSYTAIQDYCCLIGGQELVTLKRVEENLHRQYYCKMMDGEDLDKLLGELGCEN
jgi:hypothetical protein